MPRVTLHLAGPVSVKSSDGRDLTPVSMKARGMLAFLGVSAGLRAARSRLQDKMWSDRGPEQGSASLRQVLSEIRRALGNDRDALIGGPGWVGLDPDRVDVVLRPDRGLADGAVEFAEDLDIRDPEFEDWLLLQRQHYAEAWTAPTARRGIRLPEYGTAILILPPMQTGRPDLDGFVDITLRDAAMRASDLSHFDIFTDTQAEADHPDALRLLAHVVGAPDCIMMNLALVHAASGRQFCSRTFSIDTDDLAARLRQMSSDVTLLLLQAFAANAVSLPVADVFGYCKERLLAADEWLARASPHPNRLALRAYIRNTLLLERFAENPATTRAEATEMATQAVDQAPQSATALAIGAMIAMRNRRFELSADLADRATRIDPANPLARHSLSAALTFLGRHESAHDEAMRLVREPLRALSPASWPMICAATAVRAGRYDEALRYATLSHDYAPEYRPALRFLSALHFHLGNDSAAVEALTKLRALESDFSLELMASADYPVATLRAANLLGVAKSHLV